MKLRYSVRGINYIHFENLKLSHFVIGACLKLSGLYGRGERNATQIQVRQNHMASIRVPKGFDGFTILQLSDLHVDMNQAAMDRLTSMVPLLDYDVCVLTGEYRGQTYGPYDANADRDVPALFLDQKANVWRVGQSRYGSHAPRIGGHGYTYARQ